MKIFKKIVLALLFLTLVTFLFFIPRLITVKKIECKNQFDVCDEEIQNEINKSANKNLPTAKKEIGNFLSNNYLVRDFTTQYKIPNILQVDLIIEKAKFCLKSSNYDVYSYIDKYGKVLELRESCNLPVGYIDDRAFNVGEEIDKEYLSALDLLNNIFISYNVKEGSIKDNFLEINLPQGYMVIFPLNEDNQILLGSLRLIINRLNTSDSESRIIEDRINVIDLRYENPVLR